VGIALTLGSRIKHINIESQDLPLESHKERSFEETESLGKRKRVDRKNNVPHSSRENDIVSTIDTLFFHRRDSVQIIGSESWGIVRKFPEMNGE